MRTTFQNSGLLSLLLVSSALSGGCSSSSAAVDGSDAQADGSEPALDGASPDSESPADSGPADGGPVADGGQGVWLASSTGFELSESGGFQAPPSDAGPCSGFAQTFKYDVSSRKLLRGGCSGSQPLDAAVVLTAASAADLVTHLSSLTAIGPSSSCGADAPDEVLTVVGPVGTRRSYSSDFYSGCAGVDAGGQQFISFGALGTFISYVNGFFVACQAADGGVPDTSKATCVTVVGDGGAGDASDGG